MEQLLQVVCVDPVGLIHPYIPSVILFVYS